MGVICSNVGLYSVKSLEHNSSDELWMSSFGDNQTTQSAFITIMIKPLLTIVQVLGIQP